MNLQQRRSLFLIAVAAVLAAGCGGGQGGGGTASATAHTVTSGDAVITYSGTPKPQLTSSSIAVTVVGQAGATFSSITLDPPLNLLDTYLVYSRDVNGPGVLYIAPYSTLSEQFLYTHPGGAAFQGISSYGTIAFDADGFNAHTIHPDGTGFKSLTFTGVPTVYAPQYSVDGTNRAAFTNGGSYLYVAPGTGGTPTLLQTNAFSQQIAVWSPSGTQIAYPSVVGSYADVLVTPSSGGTASDITPAVLKGNGDVFPLCWSSDGVSMLALYVAGGSSTGVIVKMDVSDPNLYTAMTPGGDSDESAYFSPDGSKMVIYRTSANGATPGFYIGDGAGLHQNLAIPDPSGGSNGLFGNVSWSPFLPKETVVAATGSTFFHSAASGYLISQAQGRFGSVVAFKATTASSAAIQTPTNTGQYAPLAFTITADSITSIGYINNYFNPGTTLTLTSTPSAVVTIDATTGQVDLLAPASVAKPSLATNADGTITYKAQFKAIYDGTGKNLAPSGASSLTLNPKTGKLVLFW